MQPDRLTNDDIRIELQVEPKLIFIERNQLRWYSHVMRRDENRTPVKYYKWTPARKRSIGRPRKRWKDAICEAVGAQGDAGVCGGDGTVRTNTRMEGIHETP